MKNLGLDIIHPLLTDKIRLSILVTLASQEDAVSFNELVVALDVTKGNLATHLRKLEGQKLITVSKQFVGRKPLTTYRPTKEGKKELNNYLEAMKELISNLGDSNGTF